MRNINLDDWQKEVLDCKSKRILICKGRQIGGTTILARKAAERLAKNNNEEIMVVSITEDQAQLVLIMVLDFLEILFPKLISEKKQDTTKTKILLKNGSQIISRPVGTTGNSVRGFTKGVLWLNEASRLPEFVFEAAKPMLLTTSGDIWQDSTPYGKKGYFYECFLNKYDIWTIFYKSSEDVIKNRPISKSWTAEQRQGALELLEQEKAEMTELQYGQEYLGLFLEDLRQYFSDEIIKERCILKKPENYPKEDNYMGVDVARFGGDECSYEILNISKPVIRHIESITKKEQPTTQTEKDILDLNLSFNLRKIGIDAGSGSLGVGIFDRLLENSKTKRKIVAMNNRAISIDRNDTKQRIFKEDMYDNFLSMLEKGEINLLDDDKVRASLKSVQWELREINGMKKIHIFGNYTHIVEGLVRAAWLVKKEKSLNLRIYYI